MQLPGNHKGWDRNPELLAALLLYYLSLGKKRGEEKVVQIGKKEDSNKAGFSCDSQTWAGLQTLSPLRADLSALKDRCLQNLIGG